MGPAVNRVSDVLPPLCYSPPTRERSLQSSEYPQYSLPSPAALLSGNLLKSEHFASKFQLGRSCLVYAARPAQLLSMNGHDQAVFVWNLIS